MFQRSKLVCKAVYELGIWASDSEGSVKQWTAKLVIAVSQCCRWWWKTNVKNSDELKCVWYGTYYRFNFLIGYWNSDRQCDVIWTAAKTTKNGRPRSVDRDNNSITSLFATLLNKHDTISLIQESLASCIQVAYLVQRCGHHWSSLARLWLYGITYLLLIKCTFKSIENIVDFQFDRHFLLLFWPKYANRLPIYHRIYMVTLGSIDWWTSSLISYQ